MIKDLTGKRYGRLLVVKKTGKNKNNQFAWLCKCDCGNTIETITNRLNMGKTKSCGCLAQENKEQMHVTHGLSRSRINGTYRAMKARCLCKTHNSYKDYGGRGITICQEWLQSFCAFYEWAMKNGYNDDLSIDRIDNDKGYSPENCRWVENEIQVNNCRRNHLVFYKGEKRTLAQWCKLLDLKYAAVIQRLNKLNWSTEKALSIPTNGGFVCS